MSAPHRGHAFGHHGCPVSESWLELPSMSRPVCAESGDWFEGAPHGLRRFLEKAQGC